MGLNILALRLEISTDSLKEEGCGIILGGDYEFDLGEGFEDVPP
jgi:hypothetical protein